MTLQYLWNKFWKDRSGKVVIWQTPNLLLFAWIILALILGVIDKGRPEQLIQILASLLLGVWAILEIISGVNYFRRLLGAAVLTAIFLSFVH